MHACLRTGVSLLIYMCEVCVGVVCVYIHVCLCMYVCMYLYVCVRIYMYICVCVC